MEVLLDHVVLENGVSSKGTDRIRGIGCLRVALVVELSGQPAGRVGFASESVDSSAMQCIFLTVGAQ